MKSKISLVLLCAAAGVPAFATSSVVSYIDESGVDQYTSFDSFWSNSGTISQVEIHAYPYYGVGPDGAPYSSTTEIRNSGTINGLTLLVHDPDARVQFDSYKTSTVCGNISISFDDGAWFCMSSIYGSIGAGTRFFIDGTDSNSLYLHGERWDISAEDAASEVALISGTGSLGMNSSKTLMLNFVTEEVLKSTESLNLISSTMTLKSNYYANFAGIEIAVDGVVLSDYKANLVLDRASADFGKVLISQIPEPSAFGLLAGAFALALCAFRRRRRSR